MKSHPTDLDYELLIPRSRARMVQARQRFRYHAVFARKEPFTGAYYWIPDRDDTWGLRVFPDCFYNEEAGHVVIWPEVVQILALECRVPPSELMAAISNSPYGLPRGRVVRMIDGRFGIAHGNDHPKGTSLQTIVDAFVLNDAAATMFVDEHEARLLADTMAVRSALMGGYR